MAPRLRPLGPPPDPQASLHGLAQCALFAHLPQERLAQIARLCVWRLYAADEIIRQPEREAARLHIVVHGCVRIAGRGANGRGVSFVDWTTGAFVGEIDVLDPDYEGRGHAQMQVIEPTLIASMPGAAFLDLMGAEPAVARVVLARLSRSVSVLSARLADAMTLNVHTRIHVRLLKLVGLQAGAAVSSWRLDPAPLHRELAEHVGTTREDVTREITRLVRQGLLRKEGRAWLLPDLAALRAMVDGASAQFGAASGQRITRLD